MITISILPEWDNIYRALASGKESTGRTAGEALDALGEQLEEASTVILVQQYKGDKFFTAARQERLSQLMQVREAGGLTAEEERELESLVETELRAARERAEDIAAARAQAELSEAVRQWVSGLKDDDSLRLLMLWRDGKSLREIAEDMNISIATVARRLKRLQQQLYEVVLRQESSSSSMDDCGVGLKPETSSEAPDFG